ncbi:MAG: Nramp family divalent metal transporter [Acidobacteria bacterium]|nr:Nramp family divalent metal transporter [Acidobacteriota bacterium]
MPKQEARKLAESESPVPDAGQLPAWHVADLPEPPAWGFRNVFRVIGPGAILLGASIGSGEWLLGPSTVVKYGVALLWVTTVAVILQTLLNVEFVRYTLYTGEPIFTAYMRTRPGPTFWGWIYVLFYWLQVGWPGWAGTAAGALAAMYLTRLPVAQDASLVLGFGYFTFLLSAGLLTVGGKIERTLEYVNWFFITWILSYLLLLNVLYVSWNDWVRGVGGFLSFGSVPEGGDWFLLGAFAAYSGAGGAINATISNWFRDKGFGMGSRVGYISALVGGRKVALSPTGTVFPVTETNVGCWKRWWRFVAIDQYVLWGMGALVGMLLPALLALRFLPHGSDIRGLAVGAELARGVSGGHADSPLWVLTLLCGFWILFSTQLAIIDGFVRVVTDMLWTGSARVRRWRGGDVRGVYYAVLAAMVAWGMIALQLTQPIVLIQIGANVAGAMTILLSLHTLYVNRRFLPRPLRPPLWRQGALVLCALFYGAFLVLWMRQLLGRAGS